MKAFFLFNQGHSPSKVMLFVPLYGANLLPEQELLELAQRYYLPGGVGEELGYESLIFHPSLHLDYQVSLVGPVLQGCLRLKVIFVAPRQELHPSSAKLHPFNHHVLCRRCSARGTK